MAAEIFLLLGQSLTLGVFSCCLFDWHSWKGKCQLGQLSKHARDIAVFRHCAAAKLWSTCLWLCRAWKVFVGSECLLGTLSFFIKQPDGKGPLQCFSNCANLCWQQNVPMRFLNWTLYQKKIKRNHFQIDCLFSFRQVAMTSEKNMHKSGLHFRMNINFILADQSALKWGT